LDRPPPRDPTAELFGELSDWTPGDRWRPAIDVFETEKAVVVRVELGGVRSQDVKVTVDGDVLRIQGARRVPSGEAVVRLHRLEIAFGRFERTIRIVIPFERERVNASLEDGFLTVTLPKREAQRRRIEVENEGEDESSR
jgi:HSP20 family protein